MTKSRTGNYLFEVAWEVCNQVGGIYTVLQSKASAIQREFGRSYYLVGPYNQASAEIEFEQVKPTAVLEDVFADLEALGIIAHIGHWLVQGRPQVILLELNSRFSKLGDDKFTIWNDHGIALPEGDFEINNSVAFGSAVYELLRIFKERNFKSKVVAHFHEWQSGVAAMRIRYCGLPIISIFTTHATLLGRYLASDNPNYYNDIYYFDPYKTAKHYNIEERYLLERGAAHSANFFTTVSAVTASEASMTLGRQPDQVLPNGLNINRFTALHEFQNLHKKYKGIIHEFVMGHFFPSYTFDLDNTLYMFISGRYEYRNKGMDLFIDALHQLNQNLKGSLNAPTIVAFIVTNAPCKSPHIEAMQVQALFEDLKNICSEIEPEFGKRLLSSVAAGEFPNWKTLVPNEFIVKLKRTMQARRINRYPSIVTHDIWDDQTDPVLNHLRAKNLINAPHDNVKVIFHPQFLSTVGPLINLDYEQFVRGCHLGVFPSAYEPWGYTPLECLACGIPTVTSNLTGFGDFALRNIEGLDDKALKVIDRKSKSFDDAVSELTDYMMNFVLLDRRRRIELRNTSESISVDFDWDKLIKYYQSIYERAFDIA